jgi:hypothetical protein
MFKVNKSIINDIFQKKYTIPAILYLITFLTYGLMYPWIRFFHDEYSILLFSERMKNVSQFFTGNRPYLGFIYQPFLFLFSSNYFLWFIFGITTRWLLAYCLFLLIKEIWGDNQYFSFTASLFCIVFPAFQAQFAFMIFGILFLLFSFFLLSLIFSLKALINKQKKYLFVSFALVLSLINLVTTEYFFTLEILRYIILGFYLFKENKQNWFKRLVSESIPYLILFLISSIWRFSQQTVETTYAFNSNQPNTTFSFHSTLAFLKDLILDLWEVSIGSWIYAFYPRHLLENISLKVLLGFSLISLSIGVICILSLRFVRKSSVFTNFQHVSVLSIATLAILFAGIPFWIAKLPIGEQYMYSRWTIPFMLGVSILFTWIFYISKDHKYTQWLFAFFIALGVGNQLLVANSFRHDFDKQQSYYWQFKWRVPALENNTTIFSNMLGFNYENSDEVSGALNFFYPYDQDQSIPIFQFYLPERVGTKLLPEIQPNLPISGRRYYDSFKSNSSQAIIVDFQYPSCLKVLDPEIDIYNPTIDSLSREALQLSNNSLIGYELAPYETNQIKRIFGKQPDQDWCYYFVKADLARQFQKWDQVNFLSELVESKKFNPRDHREWFPFIEGHAQNDAWEKALILSKFVYEESPQYSQMLQALWSRIKLQTDDSQRKELAINTIKQLLDEP